MEPFDIDKPFVGMIHLLPLPGSVHYDGKGIAPILDAALQDLDALETGGADAALFNIDSNTGVLTRRWWRTSEIHRFPRLPRKRRSQR